MQFAKSRTTATAMALFLALTIAATAVALPTANAHTPAWNIPTFAYINISPNPVGVDQTATIIFWLNQPPPTAGGVGGDRWRNLKLDVTKPDGNKENVGTFTSDDVGSCYTQYTPDQVGTYKFDLSFPGQVLSLYGPTGIIASPDALTRGGDYVNDTYLPSNATATLTVQQEPIPGAPTYPLPTDYWTRPIEGQNTNWYTVASNWLGSPQIVYRFQQDGAAPNSPHIMWTQPYEFGGVVGGTNTGIPGMTYYTGMNYEAKFQTPIIINGRLYYELPLSNNNRGGGFVCVDLLTGEELWQQDITGISFGQLYDYESLNQHGVVPNGYLWKSVNDPANGGTVWMAYDPLTGNWLFNETNVPRGTTIYGPNGEILIYQMDYAGRWLAMWNNTAAPELTGAVGTGTSAYQWRPVGKNVNASTAYSWNVTIPDLNGLSSPSILYAIYDDLILGTSSTFQTTAAYGGTQNPYTMWAISLKPATRGQRLWIQNYTAPANNITRTIFTDPGWPNVDPTARVFIMHDDETMQNWGYSIDNGNLLWGPTDPELSSLGFYFSTGGQFDPNIVAYGNFYRGGYGGIIYCYNLTTGDLVFTYGNGGAGNSSYSGFATPYGRYTLGIGTAADGKLYLFSSEHSPTSPYWMGSTMRCIDAYNGTELWTLYGYAGVGSNNGMAVADGYLVYLNAYDMQLYCIGKGPSATTVEAPMTGITVGDSAVIHGTVMDNSAGAASKSVAADFPNGLPCVSDESMSQWMEYVYMQKPMPTNATGVEVSLDAVDPNGNFVHLGTVTSDASGNFGFDWKTPDVPGQYTIIATFAGSNSYYASYAETYAVVTAAPATTPPTETTTQESPMLTYLLAAAIVIIILAVVAIVLQLRRK
jgi:hypothetical protein